MRGYSSGRTYNVNWAPLLLLLSLAVVACGISKPRNNGADGGTDGGAREQIFSPRAPYQLDLLFMIDNSGSMTGAQQFLISNFTHFINVLKSLPAGMPSLHIGVVSSDLGAGGRADLELCRPGGDGGRLQSEPRVPGCLGPRDRYISASEKEVVKNYDGTMDEAFACIAALGESGCAFEHQLKSAAVALGFEGAMPPENAGFLRSGAHLAVIFLTNEDDCSAPGDTGLFDPTQRTLSDPLGPLESYRCNEFGHLCGGQRPPRMLSSLDPVELTDCHSAEDGVLTRVSDLSAFFKSLKPNPRMITMAALAPPRTPYRVHLRPGQTAVPAVVPTCVNSQGFTGDPAVRIGEFIDQFGVQGVLLPVCADSFLPAIVRAAEEIGSPRVPRCLQLDLVGGTPANPDLAADCQVFERIVGAGGQVNDVPLAKCGATTSSGVASCWALGRNNPGCSGVPDLTVTPEAGGTIVVRCAPAP